MPIDGPADRLSWSAFNICIGMSRLSDHGRQGPQAPPEHEPPSLRQPALLRCRIMQFGAHQEKYATGSDLFVAHHQSPISDPLRRSRGARASMPPTAASVRQPPRATRLGRCSSEISQMQHEGSGRCFPRCRLAGSRPERHPDCPVSVPNTGRIGPNGTRAPGAMASTAPDLPRFSLPPRSACPAGRGKAGPSLHANPAAGGVKPGPGAGPLIVRRHGFRHSPRSRPCRHRAAGNPSFPGEPGPRGRCRMACPRKQTPSHCPQKCRSGTRTVSPGWIAVPLLRRTARSLASFSPRT